MTKQKQLVLSIAGAPNAHLTAEEIFLLAKKEMPAIALGTVYRNLNILVEEGLLRRINIAGDPDRFDHAGEAHGHLICKSCGRLKDIKVDGIRESIEAATGEDILSVSLSAYYICEECKADGQDRKLNRMMWRENR